MIQYHQKDAKPTHCINKLNTLCPWIAMSEIV